MINFFTEEVKFPFTAKGIRTTLKRYVKELVKNEGNKVGEINVIFCSDAYLLAMNKQYLNHDYYTDVITFDYSELPTVSGDVFISIDTVAANAEQYAPSFEHELYRVLFHGVLHLCGYKDKSDEEEKQMREKENFYLKQHGICDM